MQCWQSFNWQSVISAGRLGCSRSTLTKTFLFVSCINCTLVTAQCFTMRHWDNETKLIVVKWQFIGSPIHLSTERYLHLLSSCLGLPHSNVHHHFYKCFSDMPSVLFVPVTLPQVSLLLSVWGSSNLTLRLFIIFSLLWSLSRAHEHMWGFKWGSAGK